MSLAPAPNPPESSVDSFKAMGLTMPIALGFGVIALFFGGFLGWAALAPLGSAAIAPGVVSVETNRKTIQHLEGGIIGAIKVKDGDNVKAGQVLVALDETQPRALLELVRVRQLASIALKARLVAERNDAKRISFPDQLRARRKETKVAEIIDGQINIFNARRKVYIGQVAILNQQIKQLAEEIKGTQGQIESVKRQITLVTDEIKDVSGLVEKGLAPRPRLRALQRDAAEIEGSLSLNRSRIAQIRQAIAETRLKINELTTAKINEVSQELRDVQSELVGLEERERAVKDILNRMVIRAPLEGTVVNLQVHTLGGVIAPGAPLLDIVPSEDRLIVDSRVSPSDIDIVQVGLLAQVRFTAFSQRQTQPVDGTVTAISADRLTDERTGEIFYLARIEIKDDLAEKLGDNKLYPGMQAEVMIVTGERTALEYFLKPITASFNRAFRED
jgi:HlyD family type I secretion membrane fusion protein